MLSTAGQQVGWTYDRPHIDALWKTLAPSSMGVPQSSQLCHNGFEIGNDATGEVDVIPIANSPAARQIAVMKKY